MLVKNDKKILCLVFNTWQYEPTGIFDYSSDAIKTNKVIIEKATYIVRNKNNFFKNIEQHSDIQYNSDEELIFHVNNGSNNTYILINPIPYNLIYNVENFKYLNNKIWYVLKSDDLDGSKKINEEYYLNQNDILKFGRVKYAIQKIHLEPKDNYNINGAEPPMAIKEVKYDISNLNKNCPPIFDFVFKVKYYSDYIDINEKIKNNEETPDKNKKCKYCNNINDINPETDDGEPNPLISLCKCKDIEDLVHYKCLKRIIQNNIENRSNPENKILIDDSITFLNFDCEKCGEQYPLKFKLPNINKIFSLYDYEEPKNCDYMILETLDYRREERYCKSIHIVKLTKEYISIGRETENDINEKDISISRNHALIRFEKENGKICLQNRSKKFGTQVLVKKPIKILDKSIYLQVGRTFIEANLLDRDILEKK